MSAAPALHFIVPVWGERYVRLFIDYCLPAQLAPGNIPSLTRQNGHRYRIFTTRADHAHLEASPAFRALKDAISVSVEFIDPVLGATDADASGAKYRIKSDCYRDAICYAAPLGAAVVALNADILLANGFVRSVVDLLARGVRVIEVPGPRGLCEPIGQELVARFRDSTGTAIAIDPVELSALWLRNLHPQLEMHYVEGPEGGVFHPSHLYWLIGQEGVIIRGFHLYPIVVVPGDSAIHISTTIDDDLVANMRLALRERYLAQDSRDMFCCELSPPDHFVGQMAERGDLRRYVEFYLSYGSMNLPNLEKEIIISKSAQLGPEWDIPRRRSASFTKHLVSACRAELRRRALRGFLTRARTMLTRSNQ